MPIRTAKKSDARGRETQPTPQDKAAVNAALELLNRRWVARIIWELRKSTLTFRELQVACGDLSTSVLNQRLADLREARLVEHRPGAGYGLTPLGAELMIAARPLLRWAPKWFEAVR
jgi:DNA-binding HxlR family transcriptional regulator